MAKVRNRDKEKTLARHCLECAKIFWVNPNRFKHTPLLYCSLICQRRAASFSARARRTEETFKKCGRSGIQNHNYGKPFSEEHKEKISKAHRGSKNYNWKGGITPFRTKIWKSEEYQNWRNAIFTRDDYTCSLCGQRGPTWFQAHHLLSFKKHPELRFN